MVDSRKAHLLLLTILLMIAPALAQGPEPIVITATNNPLPSLRDAAVVARTIGPPSGTDYEVPNKNIDEDGRSMIYLADLGGDPVLQSLFNPTVPTTLLTQFDGSDNTDNGLNVTPPDTDGDVSGDFVDRYVQMINLVTTVFDKNGNFAPGGSPFFSSAFWAGFGGLCQTNDNGDPIVIYDETNQRWLVSQFAFNSTSSPPWFQCVAVSQTSDPLGAYNRYAFDFSSIGFPDYPKHGIVTNSITIMANLFAPSFSGTFIGAMDKSCMYAGNTSCNMVGANLGTSEFGFVAGDLDDPSGTAGNVAALFGTAMTANGLFDVWEVDPDFVTPSNTTITRISRVPVAAFDSDICTAFRERCVPHPGSGDDLETLSGRLMHRLQIRDFGAHLSMMAAHTVDADAAPPLGNGRAGIRWHELRSSDGGASWSLHQEGTFAPADGLDRWMPSIAINAAGDIGVGYMTSSATMPVEIRVSGQTAANSGTGTLDADEGLCRVGVAGADWTGRSGDYSATNVDPDSDSFWHTNEFGRSTAFRGWGTAVCEFDLGGTGNQSPVVMITAPSNGANFDQGDPVMFTGTANDPEDGDISANLAWSSDLDGSLGTGASITCPGAGCSTTLSVGNHSITASVTDSGGASGSDQISITVNGPPATTMHVESIVTGTQSAPKGKKFGTATVTILDDQGQPVESAIVTGDFGGSYNETASATTDANGVAFLVTNNTAKKDIVVTFCVSNVTHGTLTYEPNDNADPGFACAPVGNPTDVHVENISTGQQGVGGGQKAGTATITILDDLGNPAVGYTVTGNFSGDFSEPGATGVTGSNGQVTIVTSGSKKGKVNVSFCVSNVSDGSLPYDPNDNTNPSYACTSS